MLSTRVTHPDILYMVYIPPGTSRGPFSADLGSYEAWLCRWRSYQEVCFGFQRPPTAHLRIDMIRYLRVRCGYQMWASSQRRRLKKSYLPTNMRRSRYKLILQLHILQPVSAIAARSQASIALTRTAWCLLVCQSCNPQPAILGPPHRVIPSSRLDASVS